MASRRFVFTETGGKRTQIGGSSTIQNGNRMAARWHSGDGYNRLTPYPRQIFWARYERGGPSNNHRQREEKSMSKFICGIAAASVIVGIIGALTVPAAASPTCMTQEEARKAFPRDHLYWHGPQRCWDNVGKRRSQKPVTNENPDANPRTEDNKPAEPDEPRRPVTAAPIPFVGNDPSAALFWPALNVQARAPENEPSPPPTEVKEDIAIGAPDAAPGSPDYLLENCCWPPSLSDGPREQAALRNMIIASTGACGLAVGLWLLVYRRRQLARLRWS